jgi:cysteinyl-tRNA synthetase
MHARHLFVNGEKMSKSLGNFFTFRDLAQKGFGGVEVRYLLLSTHYRQNCNFTLEGLEGAKKSVQRLREFDQNLAKATGAGRNPEIARTIEGAQRRFEEALDDDLNMAPALAAVFDLVRDVNRLNPSAEDAADARAFLHRVDAVLGVLDAEAGTEELPEAARDLIRQREEARAGRDFARADTLRKALLETGIEIKDTKDGAEWRRTGQTRWRRHGA